MQILTNGDKMNREQWLIERRNGIGGSDAAAICAACCCLWGSDAMKPTKLIFRNGRAETPFGDYTVTECAAGCVWRFQYGVQSKMFLTRSAAQTAAQADFERRVKECFEENDDG